MASLYGILNSNRSGKHLWGKNEFNATFPIALCCYFRDNGIGPVYVSIDSDGVPSAADGTITVEDIFGCAERGADIRFEFEGTYRPFTQMVHGSLPSIDVVTSDQQGQCRPIEIKLTVVPDSSTATRPEGRWAPELVIRPVSSAHAVLSLVENMSDDLKGRVRAVVEPVSSGIQSWQNRAEIRNASTSILDALGQCVRLCESVQRPYLVQPIWKTLGMQPNLAEQCLDVFVWSDLAVFSIPVIHANPSRRSVSRHMREAARHLACLGDLLSRGKFVYSETYGGMPLGNQTAKSFALSGARTHQYLKHDRLLRPYFGPDVLDDVILDGGIGHLRPERRFDAAIVFGHRQRKVR